jgi:hypothetical protein
MNFLRLKDLSFVLVVLFLSATAISCKTTRSSNMDGIPIMAQEPQWIRNGEPILFNNKQWFPSDGIESLLDNEVYYLGDYKEVQFFAEKIDVKPYERIYTKFGKNKFRYYTAERRR